MSTANKAPEGLKDAECEKGNLGVCPPIPYVPPADLLQTKENTDTIKLKLLDGTVFSMMIFAKGNLKECLQHVIAILCLINQKGLDTMCRSIGSKLERTSKVLENLKCISIGPDSSSSKGDQEARKVELEQTQEMFARECHPAGVQVPAQSSWR
jgi:hypothetical protein